MLALVHGISAFFFAVVAILLIIVILLQRGKGVGLAGAFGGSGGHAAFGAKTGDMLTWITVVGAGIVLLFAVILNYVFIPAPPVLEPTTPPTGSGTTPAPDEGSGSSRHLIDPAGAPVHASAWIFGETEA